MNLPPLLSSLLLVAACGVAPHAADASQATPEQLVDELLRATDDEARAKLTEQLLALAPEPAQVVQLFQRGRGYSPDVPTGWREEWVTCSDDVSMPYLLYVPEDYTPDRKYRLLVDMHGGVSQPAAIAHEQLRGLMSAFWTEHAEEHGYLLLLPTGMIGREWWAEAGSESVLQLLKEVRREYNIDENLVFATGFSDGGSGCYYLSLAHTTPFAGFLPLNGHPSVAGIGGLQVHLPNLVNKPLYAINTQEDSLYPSVELIPIFDYLEAVGAPVIWRDLPKYKHDPSYMPDEVPAMWDWCRQVVREPDPKRIVWEGTAEAPARVHWLRVLRIGPAAKSDAEFADPNPLLPPGQPRIGITIDTSFEGPGVKIETVAEESVASALGLLPDDVIVHMDGTVVAGVGGLRKALGNRTHGDEFLLTIQRGEEEHELSGNFPEAEAEPAFKRERPYASVEAFVEQNRIHLATRGIEELELYLSDRLVDLTKPVEVLVNGETVHSAVVQPDVAFIVEQALADEDRTLVYQARLRLELR